MSLPAPVLAGFADEVRARVAAAAPAARTWLFGHVGDGNLHVNVTGVAPDDAAVDDAVLGLVLDLGGSISAEHGVGTAKRGWLGRQRGAGRGGGDGGDQGGPRPRRDPEPGRPPLTAPLRCPPGAGDRAGLGR